MNKVLRLQIRILWVALRMAAGLAAWGNTDARPWEPFRDRVIFAFLRDARFEVTNEKR